MKLKELGTIVTGNTPSKQSVENWDSPDIGFVKPDIISDTGISIIDDAAEYISEKARAKARIVGENSILITCIGSIGKIGITAKGTFAFNQQINAIIPNRKVNSKYLAYALLYAKPRLVAIANAPVVPIINKSQFGDFEIKVTENTEYQSKAVEVLDTVNAIIENRRQQLQKLDELVKARFVELFGMPGTDTKGWGLQYLGTCCELNPKKGTNKRLVSGLSVSFVPMPAVSESGKIDASQIKVYDEVKTGFTYFAENDVLFAKITPCMENGKGAIAVGLCNNIGFGSTEFHILRPINDKSNPYWLYSLTSFDTFRKDAADNMTGSAGQRRVPAVFLEKYKVTLPPIELQNQFAAFVEQVDKSKVAVQKSLDEAQLLFDSLMQQYFG